jgi:hypothetical protein
VFLLRVSFLFHIFGSEAKVDGVQWFGEVEIDTYFIIPRKLLGRVTTSELFAVHRESLIHFVRDQVVLSSPLLNLS